MKILVHVGLVKTGSTVLQKCLRENVTERDQLIDRDLILILLLQLISQIPFLNELFKKLIIARLLKFKHEANSKNKNRLLFSDENYGLNIRNISDNNRAKVFAECLFKAYGEVQVFAVERDLEQWLESVWKEQSLSQPLVPSWSKFKKKYFSKGDFWHQSLEQYIEAGHHLHVIKYDQRSRHLPQLVCDLLDKDIAISKVSDQNISKGSIKAHNGVRLLNTLLFPYWYSLEIIEIAISIVIEIMPAKILKAPFIVGRLVIRAVNIRKIIRKMMRLNPA